MKSGFITAAELKTSQAEPARAHPHEPPIELEAPYVAEMVRQRFRKRAAQL